LVVDSSHPTRATISTMPATRTAWGTCAGVARNARTRSTKRASSKYETGTTTSVSKVDVIRPPIVAIEIGERNPLPSPVPTADGNMPRIIAIVVIMIGRRRTGPALRIASFTLRPSRTY
jgi:hypothetical protein